MALVTMTAELSVIFKFGSLKLEVFDLVATLQKSDFLGLKFSIKIVWTSKSNTNFM